MNKEELARILAEERNIPEGAAADQLDAAVHKILKRLKAGRPTALPGLGQFSPGRPAMFEFNKSSRKGGPRGRK